MVLGLEYAPAFRRERRGLRLEVVDRDAPVVIVAPRTRDIDWIVAACLAVAERLARGHVHLVRIRRVAVAAAAGSHSRAIGAHYAAHVELLHAVAADLTRH